MTNNGQVTEANSNEATETNVLEATEANVLQDCMSRWPVSTFLCGIGVGASLVYFFDGSRGSKRRAYVGEQVKGAIHNLEGAASSVSEKARDLGHRAKETLASSN